MNHRQVDFDAQSVKSSDDAVSVASSEGSTLATGNSKSEQTITSSELTPVASECKLVRQESEKISRKFVSLTSEVAVKMTSAAEVCNVQATSEKVWKVKKDIERMSHDLESLRRQIESFRI